MKKIIALLLVCLPLVGMAAGPSIDLHDAKVNLKDKVSLQNGLQLFVNNCQGCHSLQYMRYERVANDLGIPLEVMPEVMFTGDKLGDQMVTAMDPEDSKVWFGIAPPDLTMEAKLRSPDWVYSYLISFVPDESRPFGFNNTVFPDVGMPNVLQEMQESVSEEEFHQAMRDLTNFLTYTAEPTRMESERIGVWVLLFLAILMIPIWLLNKEYWKDVH